MSYRRLATAFALAALLATAYGCANEDYYCDDTGCYYCDGVGCREVPSPERVDCRGDFECADGYVCTDIGCVEDGCSENADCGEGTSRHPTPSQ